MSAQRFTSRASEGLEALQTGWRWWWSEFAAALPQSLRNALTGSVSIVAIDLESDAVVLRHFAEDGVAEIARMPRAAFDAAALRAALSARLSRPWFLREPVALRLPDSAALRRELSLPLAARRNIASLLDIELDRQSPLDRSEVYHDYRILHLDRPAGRINIVWRIVRRTSVAAALAVCAQAGVELATVAFINDEAPPDGGTFPVAPRAARLLHVRQWLVRGLLLLILALLLAVAAGTYYRNQQAADAFSLRADAVREEALASRHLQHEIDAARSRAARLLRERRRLTVTRVLAETTRILPDGSWLTDFAYRDSEVRLRGFSNAASSLIARFDASSLFMGAEFRAPLTQAQGPEQEQFDLAFAIRNGVK